ncbi:MAG: histidine kinase dimerization/phosphoacceptor domain -containing protein [Bacteroidota bacterium]
MKFFATLVLIILHFCAYGQLMSPEYSKLLHQYQESKPDTNRVRLLLKMDSIYLYRLSDTNQVLDSALLLAQQAFDISKSLGFKQGMDDATFRIANAHAEKMNFNSAIAVMKETQGVLRIRILRMLGERFMFRFGKVTPNLDSAFIYIHEAQELSESYSPTWQHEILCLQAKYHFAKDEVEKGTECFMKIIRDFQKSGDKKNEALWWSELGIYLPRSEANYENKIKAFNKAIELYRQVGVSDHGLWLDLGLVHEHLSRIAAAEAVYLEGLEQTKSKVDLEVCHLYSALARVNAIKGDYGKTIYYSLEAIKGLDSLDQRSESSMIEYTLADTYRALGETDKSVYWYQRSLDELAVGWEHYRFPIFGQIARGLIRQGKAQEAMRFMSDFLRTNEQVSILDKEVAAAIRGDCYNAVGDYRAAEKYYNAMIESDKQIPPTNETGPGTVGRFIQGAEAYYTMGKFYVERKKYDEAYPFFEQALVAKHYPPSLAMQRDIHLMLYKIDEARGKLASALNHFEIHKQLNDSLFSESKVRQIEELRIKYETAQNENALVLLRSKEQLQEEELHQAAQIRNYTYIIVGILILLMIVGYSRYRLKVRTTTQLREHQREIDDQNKELKQLLSSQQKLLSEKEWLIREIHHRVKNNFHIVIGLLGTQSEYVKNEEAHTAIRETKQRIHAMSLLHQKLYQSTDLSAVHMPDYIFELVLNLQESSDKAQSIRFDHQVEKINLDLAHALPIGLILNEAVTNSIKYAFPDQRKGTITIVLKYISENVISLVIEDDGVGITGDITQSKNPSMGLNLIKGLSEDMEGTFKMEGKGGTRIEVEFRYGGEVE